MKGFSQLGASLTDLTKKGAFRWTEEAQVSFDQMKKVMRIFPILAVPNFSQPFLLECDTFKEGIGAIMMQNCHPIAFESRKLRELERIYSICDKEMLSIMHALAKF